MNKARLCCCVNNPYPCDAACGFDSSYLVTNFSALLSMDRLWKQDGCDTGCNDYDGANVNDDHTISATVTQSGAFTITKDAVRCCYTGFGQCSIQYNWYMVQRYFCCGQNPTNSCTHTQSFIGTQTGVPFCYTVQCDPTGWNGLPGWRHTITICGFALGLGTRVGLDDGDCPPGGVIDCEEPPLSRCGFYMGGATYSWVTPLKALDSFGANERQPKPCYDALECGPGAEENLHCIEDEFADHYLNGPFSIYAECDPPWKAEPDPCNRPAGAAAFVRTYYGCSPKGDQCTGGIDYEDDCCEQTTTWNAVFPTII